MNISEEKKKYEKEFCDLLIKRVNHAGGSLQFQHLSSVIQQARFQIRDAFGTTNRELMKFLKAHPKIFQIDTAAGIVTILQSSIPDNDTEDSCTNKDIKYKKFSFSKIEKGIGIIQSLHQEGDFGIIKATDPIQTFIHFKPQAFFKNKDYMLTDSPFEIGDEVYFNADHWDEDNINGIRFSATKVWQKLNESENSNKTREPPVSNELNGHGVVQMLQGDRGVISFKKEKIFFYKSVVKDCNCDDLKKFLKNGDYVEFFARFNEDSKRWRATSVRKKSQNVKSPNDTSPVKIKLENEPGKIYPTSFGAVIKFGKNFTEQANGNSCSYFLYGGEVADIKYEFSEGDDVFFDAEKTKSAKWRALLVWVGEKPACFKYKKTFSESKREVSDDESVYSSKASSISHSTKHMSERSQSASKSKRVEKNKMFSDNDSSRRNGRYNERCEKQNSKPQNTENFPTRKSKNGKERNMNENENSFINRRGQNTNRRVNERKFPSKTEQKKSFSKKTTAMYESEEEITKTDGNIKSIDKYTPKDNYSVSSQDDSDADCQDNRNLTSKYLVTEEDENCPSSPKNNFSDISDNDEDYTCDENSNHDNEKVASIKVFNDIEGRIVHLYCKAAIVENSCLQKNVDFLLNDFYLNAKSVEEQQVIDLKEVIKAGEVIKFNCFEIIDDEGEIHQKVTMAWKGPRPEVYQMSPEEFINEHDLSVTINKKPECLSSEAISKNIFSENKDFKSTPEEVSERDLSFTSNWDKIDKRLEPKTLSNEITGRKSFLENDDSESTSSESTSESESEEELSDEDSKKFNSDSLEKEDDAEEERFEKENEVLDVHKSLSETILERLKYKGLIPSNAQVNFSGLLTEVTNLVQKHCDKCNNTTLSAPNQENLSTLSKLNCHLCEKTQFEENKCENHTAAQTIITGGIIAQSIYTQP